MRIEIETKLNIGDEFYYLVPPNIHRRFYTISEKMVVDNIEIYDEQVYYEQKEKGICDSKYCYKTYKEIKKTCNGLNKFV